ncbi:MAG: isochorismatase family protein [Pseudomonadota bacterium]
MIEKFGKSTALLLIDVQAGVNVLQHWGGKTGRRNNPDAESKMLSLLNQFREQELPTVFTRHDSREADSPLKFSLKTGQQINGFEIQDSDIVITKDVNSGFVGTNLEIELRRLNISRLVVVGFFTNFCVETTVRMAGNLGFDVYLVEDACATTNRIGFDGTDHDPEVVHQLSVASMHGEFCTAISASQAMQLCTCDMPDQERKQGNE